MSQKTRTIRTLVVLFLLTLVLPAAAESPRTEAEKPRTEADKRSKHIKSKVKPLPKSPTKEDEAVVRPMHYAPSTRKKAREVDLKMLYGFDEIDKMIGQELYAQLAQRVHNKKAREEALKIIGDAFGTNKVYSISVRNGVEVATDKDPIGRAKILTLQWLRANGSLPLRPEPLFALANKAFFTTVIRQLSDTKKQHFINSVLLPIWVEQTK